jgi:hypothetical protein
MKFKDWISDRKNLFMAATPLLFFTGLIFLGWHFAIGVLFGICVMPIKDYMFRDD